MAKHVSYRGTTIDMESMSREHASTPAVGNMGVNARGDKIQSGAVTKTADQLARERHNVKSSVVKTGLKGAPEPQVFDVKTVVEQPKPVQKTVAKHETVKATKTTKTVEKELPNGDIELTPGDNTNED